MELPDDQRQAFAALFREARESRNLHQYQVAQQTGVNQNTIGQLERNGPYPGLRAIDLLALVEFYNLEIRQVAQLLSVNLGPALIESRSPMAIYASAIRALPAKDQEFIIEAIGALYRGVVAKRAAIR